MTTTNANVNEGSVGRFREELSRPVDWVFRRRSVGCSIGRVVRLVCRF